MRAIEAVSKIEKKWADLIRQQSQSKLSMSAFCREHGFSDQAFYNWRKRLSGSESVKFALVETDVAASKDTPPIELMLASGDRLRITAGAEAATLRTLVNLLRERA